MKVRNPSTAPRVESLDGFTDVKERSVFEIVKNCMKDLQSGIGELAFTLTLPVTILPIFLLSLAGKIKEVALRDFSSKNVKSIELKSPQEWNHFSKVYKLNLAYRELFKKIQDYGDIKKLLPFSKEEAQLLNNLKNYHGYQSHVLDGIDAHLISDVIYQIDHF